MATASVNNEEAVNELKVDVCLDKIPEAGKNKSDASNGRNKYKSDIADTIDRNITALLNSSGGVLRIGIETSGDLASDELKEDDLIRSTEQRLSEKTGSLQTSQFLHIEKDGVKEIVFRVKGADKLITTSYNLYVATTKQILLVRSFEEIDELLTNHEPRKATEDLYSRRDYVLGEKIGTENKTLQFKLLKSEPAKNVTLPDRIAKPTNLQNVVSAFANCDGGCILYGVTDAGIVEGQKIPEGRMEVITKKVKKAIEGMLWPTRCRQPEQGKQWDIAFRAVKDDVGNPIRSLFVIVVVVAPCPGGLFTKEPECYHVIHGEVKRMDHVTWKKNCSSVAMKGRSERKISTSCVPQVLKRVTWYHKVFKSNYSGFTVLFERSRKSGYSLTVVEEMLKDDQRIAEVQEEMSQKTIERQMLIKESNLVRIFQKASLAFMRGEIERACELCNEFRTLKDSAWNAQIFELDEIYLLLVLYRYQGNLERSLELANAALQKIEFIEPCLTTAWLYSELVTAFSSCAWNDFLRNNFDSAEDLVQKAVMCCELAIEHAKNLDSEEASCDIQCKVYSQWAMLLVKTPFNGSCIEEAPPVWRRDIDVAILHLARAEKLVETCIPYIFNRCLCHLANSDVHYRLYLLDADNESSLRYLQEAVEFAKKAKQMARSCNFAELYRYGYSRKAFLKRQIEKYHVYR